MNPILDYIIAQRQADIARLRLKAASGSAGSVAARVEMRRLVADELRDEVQNRATAWRGKR